MGVESALVMRDNLVDENRKDWLEVVFVSICFSFVGMVLLAAVADHHAHTHFSEGHDH
jgi:hypothetical protein